MSKIRYCFTKDGRQSPCPSGWGSVGTDGVHSCTDEPMEKNCRNIIHEIFLTDTEIGDILEGVTDSVEYPTSSGGRVTTIDVHKLLKAQYQKIIDEIEKHIYHQRDTIMIGGFAVYHERTAEDILRYLKGEK